MVVAASFAPFEIHATHVPGSDLLVARLEQIELAPAMPPSAPVYVPDVVKNKLARREIVALTEAFDVMLSSHSPTFGPGVVLLQGLVYADIRAQPVRPGYSVIGVLAGTGIVHD